MSERKYLPTIAELFDRLTVVQLKEVKLQDNKEEYSKEISDILHDIDLLISNNKEAITADLLRDIIVLAQFNAHIWYNESAARQGNKDGNMLLLTHSINGIRNTAKNKISSKLGGRLDFKIDCLAAEYTQWTPSGYEAK